MEIQVGEYVRTDEGKIAKVLYFEKEQGAILNPYLLKLDYYKDCMTVHTKEEIEDMKHSFNIIDLMEAGDIIKFEYNNAIYIEKIIGFDCGDTYYLEVCFSPEDGIGYNMNIFDEDIKIKSIVTKEQFKSIEYKIEEEK